MSETTRARLRAATVAVAPVVLLAAFVWHPYLPGRLPNDAAIAAAVAADTTRWGLAHLAAGVGSGVLVLAFLSIRSYLREAGEDQWSPVGLPFIVIGSTLYTLLPGMEFAPLAAAEVGGNVQAAQAVLTPWFVSILVAGAVTFGIGILGFARGIALSGALSPELTWVVVGALIATATARFIPLAAVQFYVQGAAGIVAFWPLAYVMVKHPAARPTRRRDLVPAT